MQPVPHDLINTTDIELWPAHLLRARSSRDARALARATRVLRRKGDGVLLAADQLGGLLPLVLRLTHQPGIDAALDALDAATNGHRRMPTAIPQELPLDNLASRLAAFAIDPADYAATTGLAPVAEPSALAYAGRDRFRRVLWLRADAARAWQQMQRAARRDDIALDAISGYRSHAYQAGIIERKRSRGERVADILRINAAPGFSEHHSGRALDIGTPGAPPAEESFESTPAFRWLSANAGDHGFTMSYPRDNPHGIVFEPWHWAYRGS